MDDVRALFPAARGYLDTATCGLAGRPVLDGVEEHLRLWREGTGSLPAFHAPVERARDAGEGAAERDAHRLDARGIGVRLREQPVQ